MSRVAVAGGAIGEQQALDLVLLIVFAHAPQRDLKSGAPGDPA